MAPPLVQMKEIRLTFGGTPLLTNAELTLSEGERLCLVGRNGSGKSTFLKILAGDVHADHGERFLQPDTTLRYLPQEPDLSAFDTIRDYVIAGLNETDDPFRADYLIDALKLDGAREPVNLSGGEIRRAALARVMAPEPDILLLDEPTNHLDLPAIEWLESELSRTASALVLISHDRTFLRALSRGTVWLDRGITHRIPQGFGGFEEWRDQFFEDEEKSIHKMKQKIAMEEDWLRYGVTARRKRNQKRLGALIQLRADHAQRKTDANRPDLEMKASPIEQSGRLVIEANEVSKAYGDNTILDGFSIKIARGECIAIVGPNGAGKTTLLNILTGENEPDAGSVRLGSNLEIATLDQTRAMLSDEWTLKQAISQGTGDMVNAGGQTKHIMSYLKDFLFRPEQANTPIGNLSGGERGRVMLARALSRPSNLMVLDEPTNDLDIETLDLLQELLSTYEGTVILVSHDRDFIDRVATSTIAYDADAKRPQEKWQVYAGGYSDMLTQRAGKTGETRKADKTANAIRKTEPQARSARSANKLSFKQEHALKALPDEIDKLENDIRKLADALSDPGLYERDPARFEKYTKALTARQTRLEAAETEWLELEELRESLA
ncbi:MAG: ABC-F family ATP-binding cassette domain-containing protein [Pseudomonadota bacterium]